MKLTEKKTHKAKNKRREGRGAGRVKNLVIISVLNQIDATS
jgi:hypothetical protein